MTGASPDGDRAVAATPSSPQAVSPVPASIPSAVDADGLDIVEALVADACAVERPRGVHEGGEYYAERIVRRALEQGTIALAKPPRGHEGLHMEFVCAACSFRKNLVAGTMSEVGRCPTCDRYCAIIGQSA